MAMTTTTLVIPDEAYSMLSHSEIAVLTRIVSLITDTTACKIEMSAELLAKQMTYGITTVKRAVKKLCEKNIITRTKTRYRGLYSNCIWQLHLDELEKSTPTAPPQPDSDLLKAVENYGQNCTVKKSTDKKCPMVAPQSEEALKGIEEIQQKMDILKKDILIFEDEKSEILEFVKANSDNPNIVKNVIELLDDIDGMIFSAKEFGHFTLLVRGRLNRTYSADEIKHALEQLDIATFKRVALKLRVNKPRGAECYVVRSIMNNAKDIERKKEKEVPQELKEKLPQNDLTDKQIKHILESIRRHKGLETDAQCIEELAKIIDYCRQNSDGPIINLYKYVMKTIEHPEKISSNDSQISDKKETESKQLSGNKAKIKSKINSIKEKILAREKDKAENIGDDGTVVSAYDFSDFQDDF